MPSKSAKQAKFMRAVAHSPKFAKKVGVSQGVGKDFEMADKKTRKFGSGGSTDYPIRIEFDKKKPAAPKRTPKEEAEKGAMEKKYPFNTYKAKGGKVMKKSDKAGRAMVKKSADTMGRAMVKKMAKGGLAGGHKAADGVAKKGKTKARKVAMNKGGYC